MSDSSVVVNNSGRGCGQTKGVAAEPTVPPGTDPPSTRKDLKGRGRGRGRGSGQTKGAAAEDPSSVRPGTIPPSMSTAEPTSPHCSNTSSKRRKKDSEEPLAAPPQMKRKFEPSGSIAMDGTPKPKTIILNSEEVISSQEPQTATREKFAPGTKMKVAELRSSLAERGLDTKGTKPVLVARLVEALEAEKSPEEKAPEAAKKMETEKAQENGDTENGESKEEKEGEKKEEKKEGEERGKKRKAEDDEVKEDEPKIDENKKLICLDWYNLDLHLRIQEDKMAAQPNNKDGWGYVYAGGRATHGFASGKIYFEVKYVDNLETKLDKEDTLYDLRVGWSTNDATMQLGEDEKSWCYTSSTGKMVTNKAFEQYGEKFEKGDVIGAFLDLDGDEVRMTFTKNGEDQGDAFQIPKAYLAGAALFPHILVKNVKFEVNFGMSNTLEAVEAWKEPLEVGYVQVAQAAEETRVKGTPTTALISKMTEQNHHFCSSLIKDLFARKMHKLAWPFKKPVDADRLGLHDYYEKIKNPMDLSKIQIKLDKKEYSSIQEFEQDFDLMINNCLSYNNAEDEVVQMATKLNKVFVQRMSVIKEQRACVVQSIQPPDGVKESTPLNSPVRKNNEKASESTPLTPSILLESSSLVGVGGSQAQMDSEFEEAADQGVKATVPLEDSPVRANSQEARTIYSAFSPEATDQTELVCPLCSIVCIGVKALKDHTVVCEAAAAGPSQGAYRPTKYQFEDRPVCEICDKSFKSHRTLENHMKQQHKITPPPKPHMAKEPRGRPKKESDDHSSDVSGKPPAKRTSKVYEVDKVPVSQASRSKIGPKETVGDSIKTTPKEKKQISGKKPSKLISDSEDSEEDSGGSPSSPIKSDSGETVDQGQESSGSDSDTTATSSKAPPRKRSLKDFYDSDEIFVKISNDSSITLERRVCDALMAIGLDMSKCSTPQLERWYYYLEHTMGCDPIVINATLLCAVASQSNGAQVEVNAAKNHYSANNLYSVTLGEKGINKSGGRDKIILPLLEIEQEIVDGYRKDHEMYLNSSRAAESTPTKDSSLKTPTKNTPLKNISQQDNEDSPSKEKPFNEKRARFILQSGSPEGMMGSMMSSVHNDFVAEYDEGGVLLKMLWNKDGDSTTLASRIQTLFSSKETRVSNVRGGDRSLKNATLQIAAAVQPELFLDTYIKDSRDAGGTIDRFIFTFSKPVELTMREQDKNVDNMTKEEYPVKRLLKTTKEIHPTRNTKWPFSVQAKEAIYRLNESMANDRKQDTTGAVRPMNAKGMGKLVRLAMNFGIIRVCEEYMRKQDEAGEEDIEFDEGKRVINTVDVLRGAHLLQHSNSVFWALRQGAKEGSASATKEIPGGGGFTADINHWNKHLTDTEEKHRHFEKVKGIYRFTKEDEGDNADKVMLKDVVGDRSLFVRASSKSGVGDKAACLHYFRVLQFNGLGKVLFGNKPDEGQVTGLSKSDYNRIRFQIYTNEDAMPGNGANLIQHIMIAHPDFKPFEEFEEA